MFLRTTLDMAEGHPAHTVSMSTLDYFASMWYNVSIIYTHADNRT